MNRKTVKQAFYKTLPVAAGYLVLGMGFGILLYSAGYGVLWAFSMSLFIYAGSLQYVGVGLISGGATLMTAAIASFMVNARHLFYSVSMIDKYKDAGKYKPYLVFSLTDETYSLLSDGKTPAGTDPGAFRFLVSLFNHCYWVTGSVLGSLAGGALPFSAKGIEFSMTALFVSSFAAGWRDSKDRFPALAGLFSTIACRAAFGAENFLIPSMLLITLALLARRKKEVGP